MAHPISHTMHRMHWDPPSKILATPLSTTKFVWKVHMRKKKNPWGSLKCAAFWLITDIIYHPHDISPKIMIIFWKTIQLGTSKICGKTSENFVNLFFHTSWQKQLAIVFEPIVLAVKFHTHSLGPEYIISDQVAT